MSSKSTCPKLPPAPQELKPLFPFLQRAQEIENRDRVVSYWCKMHVARTAFNYTASFPQIKPWLKSLIDVLEWEKTNLGQEEAVTNELVAQAHLENFALQIFSIADNEEQAGRATIRTAKIFLAASHYLEVLASVFRKEDMDDVKEKIKYAKWKATAILKQPALPPSSQSASISTDPTFPSLPPSLSSPPPPVSSSSSSASATFTSPLPPPTPAAPVTSPLPKYDVSVLSDAQKSARFVISALEYEDVPTAILHLEKALALLSPYRTLNAP